MSAEATSRRDTATTASRMRLLRREFTTAPRPAPTQFVDDPRTAAPRSRTSPAHSPAPMDLGVLDHVIAAVTEVIEHTLAVAPDAGPAPTMPDEVYQWAATATSTAGPGEQQARDTIIYRQGLEHAIAMGEDTVIRRHPCPQCGTYGLLWQSAARRAVCVHTRCTTRDGGPTSWSLAQLARHHVAATNSSARRAT
ncbi:hypothetical protein ACIPW9_36560 [Streptomyces sp. NPDC090052]|uniref:hypothetical protein n=1 Tax=Streptomyces sp. NPDC090052 TaxID=3365931 RepID=UPI0037FF3594